MPTLFRLIFVAGVVYALGYGAVYATATLLRPEPRLIVQAVALPQDTDVHTGRSAAKMLNDQASSLVRHTKARERR